MLDELSNVLLLEDELTGIVVELLSTAIQDKWKERMRLDMVGRQIVLPLADKALFRCLKHVCPASSMDFDFCFEISATHRTNATCKLEE